MTKINRIYQKPIIIILIMLALACFIGSIFLFVYSQKQQIKPNTLLRPNLSTDVFLNLAYTFNGTLPQLETEISIFQIPANNQSLDEKVVSQYGKAFGLGDKFQFLPGVKSNGYLFTKNSEELVITTNPNILEYANYNQPSNSAIDESKYMQLASDFLIKNKLLPKFWELDQGYFQAMTTDFQGIAIPTETRNGTKFIQISFNYLLDNKPFLDKQNRDYPIKILFNLDGSIRKATVLLPPSTVTSVGKTSVTTPQQALTALNNGLGTFTTLNNSNQAYTELKPNELTNGTFNSVEIIYIYDYDTGSIQPFYRFSGYGYTKNGDKIDLGVIITALSQELYQK